MRKLFFLLMSSLVLQVSLFAAGDPKYFCPKLYENLYPDLCLKHLSEHSGTYAKRSVEYTSDFFDSEQDDASEEDDVFTPTFEDLLLCEDGSFKYPDLNPRKFSEEFFLTSVEALDEETISRLSRYFYQIPTNDKICDFRECSCPRPAGLMAYLRAQNIKNIGYEKWTDIIRSEIPQNEYRHIEYECKTYYDCDVEPESLCPNQAVPNIYFENYTNEYIRFLEQTLIYSEENTACSCYWPYRNKLACDISDFVYNQMIKDPILNRYRERISEKIGHDCFDHSSLAMLQRLFVHSFFYSHYRYVLLELGVLNEIDIEVSAISSDQGIRTLDSIYSTLNGLQDKYINLYSECLEKHPHAKIFYERGMIYSHQGRSYEALSDIQAAIDYAQIHHRDDLLTTELYCMEGAFYAEMGLYDQAVQQLTKSILKDPLNKEAYFERACAYFELGEFDLSLQDYLVSGFKSHPFQDTSGELYDFSKGLIKGIVRGGTEGVIDFFPSLISSFSELGKGLWAFAEHPEEVSKEFLQSVQITIQAIRENTIQETLGELIPELQELFGNWDQLLPEQKGEIVGHIIGKYGVDIFAGVGLTKGIKAYQNLRRANRLATFEMMELSKRNLAVIKGLTTEKITRREFILKHANLNIVDGKQGKHVIGHKNYELMRNRSILEHRDPQQLVYKFAGTGWKDAGKPGVAGYKEYVDFQEFIGYVVDEITGVKKQTTWGKIHYAKDGVHIVPSLPQYYGSH